MVPPPSPGRRQSAAVAPRATHRGPGAAVPVGRCAPVPAGKAGGAVEAAASVGAAVCGHRLVDTALPEGNVRSAGARRWGAPHGHAPAPGERATVEAARAELAERGEATPVCSAVDP